MLAVASLRSLRFGTGNIVVYVEDKEEDADVMDAKEGIYVKEEFEDKEFELEVLEDACMVAKSEM